MGDQLIKSGKSKDLATHYQEHTPHVLSPHTKTSSVSTSNGRDKYSLLWFISSTEPLYLMALAPPPPLAQPQQE
jgi:hypothetical protein